MFGARWAIRLGEGDWLPHLGYRGYEWLVKRTKVELLKREDSWLYREVLN